MQKPSRLWRIDQKISHYIEFPEAGVPLEEVLAAPYWVNCRRQYPMRLFDTFRFIAKDGSYDVEATIVMLAPESIKWRVLREWRAAAGQAEAPRVVPDSIFIVKSAGRAGGYRIHNRQTGNVVAEGMDKGTADAECLRMNTEKRMTTLQAA